MSRNPGLEHFMQIGPKAGAGSFLVGLAAQVYDGFRDL